jgi:hypothetical protein
MLLKDSWPLKKYIESHLSFFLFCCRQHFAPNFMAQTKHPSRMACKAISWGRIGRHPNPKQNALKWRIGAANSMRPKGRNKNEA